MLDQPSKIKRPLGVTEIKQSNLSVAFAVLFSLLFGAGSARAFYSLVIERSQDGIHPLLFGLFLFMCMLGIMVGLLGLFLLAKLIAGEGAKLILSQRGMQNFAHGNEQYFLPWTEIEAISEYKVQYYTFLLIMPKDIDRLVTSGKVRKFWGFNSVIKKYGTPFLLQADALKISNKDLKNLLEQYLKTYGSKA